jgi:nucleoside-diphosphate-sugar epimerase
MLGNIDGFLEHLEVLIINVPPRLRGDNTQDYVKKMAGLHRAIQASKTQKIIFVSSTSVYGNAQGIVTEATTPQPITVSGAQLLASEKLFINDPTLTTAVVRFGGLIGYDRHPVTMLSGKNGLSNGLEPVNLIHLDDCIAILQAIVRHQWWQETFNGVYPVHPLKKDYYTQEALKRGLPPPIFSTHNKPSGKEVHPANLLTDKKYRFKTSIIG